MNVNGISNFGWSDLLSGTRKRTASAGQNSTPAANDLAGTVNLSSAGNGYRMDWPGVHVGPDGRMGVTINEALTPRDKEIVIAATGGLDLIGPDGVHQVNLLAVQIALDRALGNLDGPVTASYLNNIAASQRRDLALNQQQADEASSAGDSVTASALRAMGPGVSFDVLDKAIAFLSQHAGDSEEN